MRNLQTTAFGRINADFHALLGDDCITQKGNALGNAICCLILINLWNLWIVLTLLFLFVATGMQDECPMLKIIK